MTKLGLRQDATARPMPGTALIDARNQGLSHWINNHRSISLFASQPWIETIANTYGFSVAASVHTICGRPVGALIYSRIEDVRGERIVSFPFCDYCDPLMDDPDTWQALVAPLLAMQMPITFRCLREKLPAMDARLKVVGRAAWHGIDLTRSANELWSSFASKARRNVRKAQRSGAIVRLSSALEDLRIFYGIHFQVRKSKYRLFAQPWAFFEHLHAAFSSADRLAVLLTEVAGRPVAGMVLLEWGDTLYVKFSGAIEHDMYPSDLLVWEAIQHGQRRGLARFDYGASDYDQPGLIYFKEKYATDRGEILRLRWEPPGYADLRAEQGDRLLATVTRHLTNPAVPDEITIAAGSELYGHFC